LNFGWENLNLNANNLQTAQWKRAKHYLHVRDNKKSRLHDAFPSGTPRIAEKTKKRPSLSIEGAAILP